MVKIHCDRCGKEIVGEHYYTIIIGKAELNPKYSISDCANALSAAAYAPEKSPYEKLSSQVMYCEECKGDIEYFIDNGESKEDTKLRELSDFENLSD